MHRLLTGLIVLLTAVTGIAADTMSPIRAEDALLVLVPHPDDEVVGCGGLIQRANAAGARVRVVFLTVGDANEWSFIFWKKRPVIVPSAVLAMGRTRHREALAAARVLGVDQDSLTFLGYPDHGTEKMLLSNYGEDRPSVAGNFTRARKVPYDFAFRRGAPHRGDSVLADLKDILQEFKPTRLCVSHPADHHPDHHALYLYSTIALWDLHPEVNPSVHPFLVHYPRWPAARGFSPSEPNNPPAILNAASWVRLPLDHGVIETKKEALSKHATQYNYSSTRLLPFVRKNELFGDFPPLVLRSRAKPVEISDDEASFEDATATDLIEAEDEKSDEASFVDLEDLILSINGESLAVRMRMDRKLPAASFATLRFLGWRKDTAFDAMPKVTVTVGATGVVVTDNGRAVRGSGVSYVQDGKTVQLTIPLILLGRPQKVLFGAATSAKERVFDQVPWRTLLIE